MSTPDKHQGQEKKKYRDLGDFGTAVKDALTLPRPVRWIRSTIAVSLWGALITQVLVFDFVGRAIAAFPNLEPLLRFRFLIILVLAAVILLSLRNRYLLLFAGYIAFFPLVVLVWLLPRTLIHNWIVVVAFWPAIYSFFSTFRISFCLWVAAVVSCFGILLFDSPATIATGMAILGTYFVTHYGRRVRTAFSSKTGFAALTPMVRGVWNNSLDAARLPIDAESGSQEYQQQVGQRLVNIYLTTSMLYSIGEKLRVVIRANKLDLYLVSSFVYTFVLTIVIFAFQYLGLQRLAPEHFSGASDAGLLEFFGYSLSTALNAGISRIVPATLTAQMLSYAELMAMLSLAILFVFMLFTSIRERHRQDLDEVVQELGGASERMGTFLLENHDLTIAAADQFLLQFNPLIARWILKLRYGEDRAKEIPGFLDDEPGDDSNDKGSTDETAALARPPSDKATK